MIKARVSKNLRGTIMLPTLSKMSFSANRELLITQEQFMSADIQGAIAKKLITVIEGAPDKSVKFSKVTNLSFSSVSLPHVAVVRAGKTIDVPTNLIKTPEYQKLIADGVIAVDLKFKIGKSENEEVEEDIDPSIPANMQIAKPIIMQPTTGKDGLGKATPVRGKLNNVKKAASKKSTPDKQNKHRIKPVEKDSLLIDPNAPDEDREEEDFLLDPRTGKKVTGDDGIIFVDHEQVQERMNQRLRNRNGK